MDRKSEPVYKRIADALRSRIESGELAAGSRLPSLRVLALEEGVSVGTARHVYDLLEQEGIIELRRGRGSFVTLPLAQQDPEGRKERALRAIDTMIGELSSLGFSTREAQIFFELRLRQMEDSTRPVRLAVVAATPEERSILGEALEKMEGVGIHPISYSDLLSQPGRLRVGFDLVAAPAPLIGDLRRLVPEGLPLMPVALTLSHETAFACRRIPKGSRIGVLTASEGFGRLIQRECIDLLPDSGITEYGRFGDRDRTREFIRRQDVLLLSPNYSDLVETAELKLFRGRLLEGKTLVRVVFECDEGSLLYLGNAIELRYRALREFLPG